MCLLQARRKLIRSGNNQAFFMQDFPDIFARIDRRVPSSPGFLDEQLHASATVVD
jgi:hypothetical protein